MTSDMPVHRPPDSCMFFTTGPDPRPRIVRVRNGEWSFAALTSTGENPQHTAEIREYVRLTLNQTRWSTRDTADALVDELRDKLCNHTQVYCVARLAGRRLQIAWDTKSADAVVIRDDSTSCLRQNTRHLEEEMPAWIVFCEPDAGAGLRQVLEPLRETRGLNAVCWWLHAASGAASEELPFARYVLDDVDRLRMETRTVLQWVQTVAAAVLIGLPTIGGLSLLQCSDVEQPPKQTAEPSRPAPTTTATASPSGSEFKAPPKAGALRLALERIKGDPNEQLKERIGDTALELIEKGDLVLIDLLWDQLLEVAPAGNKVGVPAPSLRSIWTEIAMARILQGLSPPPTERLSIRVDGNLGNDGPAMVWVAKAWADKRPAPEQAQAQALCLDAGAIELGKNYVRQLIEEGCSAGPLQGQELENALARLIAEEAPE